MDVRDCQGGIWGFVEWVLMYSDAFCLLLQGMKGTGMINSGFWVLAGKGIGMFNWVCGLRDYKGVRMSGEKAHTTPPLPDFVLELVYPEFMPPEDEVLLTKEQSLPAAVLPTADSPGYVLESDSKEDPEEDLEEDPVDYPADGGDDGDDEDESSEDSEEHHFGLRQRLSDSLPYHHLYKC
ncbi:hypothetical protein Tco_0041261 [Tanacetum coccineum]